MAINWNYSGDKARSVLCQSRLGFSSWSAVPNQTKPGRCFGFKQANCFGNNISVFQRNHISSEISTRTWKPLTLPYEKSNTGGNKSWLNICSPKKTWHESQQWTGSLRSLTSSPPPLGEINMSHPLFSCRWLLHKHKHPGRACVQLDGFPVEQEEAQPVWWKRHHAALPEGQPGALSRCLFDSKMRWQ